MNSITQTFHLNMQGNELVLTNKSFSQAGIDLLEKQEEKYLDFLAKNPET